LAESTGDARRQALALFRLGYDRPEVQLEYWEKAISLFHKVGDLNSAASLLYVTARFRILLTGDIARAQKDLDQAAQFGRLRIRNMGGVWEEEAFAKSLLALMQGQYEEAAAMLEETVNLAEELGNRMGYSWTRVNLGYIALRAGNLTKARAIFVEIAQNFQEDSSTIGVIFALEGLAQLSVAVGKPELAACLIGWADATREKIINPRPLLEQANIDQSIAACLGMMDESAFADAYDAGKMMTLDEAVAQALAAD
jgi:tetratricopeptide (TPR) repeat protein